MVNTFIKQYHSSLEKFDPKSVAQYYNFPINIFTEDGESIMFSEDLFLAYSDQLFREYQSLGISKLDHKIISRDKLSQNLLLVSIAWQFIDPQKNVKYDATIRYVLSSVSAELKIVSVYIVDERKRFNEFRKNVGS